MAPAGQVRSHRPQPMQLTAQTSRQRASLFEQRTTTGLSLEPQVDDALRAGLIARAAADAAALVDLGHAVGVQRDRAEAADLHARTAAGAAVEAKIVALRALVGAAAAVAVDAGNLDGNFFLTFISCNLPVICVHRACRSAADWWRLAVEPVIGVRNGRCGGGSR